MNKLLDLQLKDWKLTGTINRLQSVETRSTDEDTELTTATTEYADVNAKLVAEGERERTRLEAARLVHTTDPAVRENRALLSRGNLGEVITAVREKRSPDGATLEAQQAHECGPNQWPVDGIRLEQRAVTPSIGNVATEEADVLTPVFETGVGAFLGVDRPPVPMGDAVYPVLTTRPTVGGPHSDSTDVPDTTGGFDADLLAPERIGASFVYRRMDAIRFPAMDPALRMALNMGLEEKLDYEVIAGANGLLTGANLANHNVAAVTAFADYISRFAYARVDGRFAAELADLRTVAGAGTYGHMGSVYRSNNADYSVVDSLMAKTAGVRVSAHVPAVSAAHKQNAVIRLGKRRDMVQPVWQAVTIIVDEYGELAGKGEIEVIRRAGHEHEDPPRGRVSIKQQTQHAA